jgi:hypothetical protein
MFKVRAMLSNFSSEKWICSSLKAEDAFIRNLALDRGTAGKIIGFAYIPSL